MLQQKESYSPFSDPVVNNKSAKKFDALAILTTSQGIKKKYIYIQGVPGGKDLTSGECSLGQTIPI